MNKNNVNQVVNEFYDNDVFFEDPIHRIKGRESVIKYYESMYKNVVEIKFDFSDSVDSGQMVVLVWTMKLRAKGLRNAEELIVAGNSVLKFNSNGKVFYHRDYFDMGEFIYENLPILNVVIRKIKEKLKE